VPTLHLVIVVSSYVDDACPDASEVGAELQHLVDAIVPIIKPIRPAESGEACLTVHKMQCGLRPKLRRPHF
jgi:hypothetical protein